MGKMLGGGVEAVVMNYYRHIDRSQVQFDFLVDSDSTLVPRDEIESLGGRVFIIPPYQKPLAYQRELVKLFAEQQWPIVHSHINTLSVFPLRAAQKAGIPVRIAHSHSTGGRGEKVKNIAKAILKTQSNRYPTERFACSRFAGEWLFGRKEPFELVYNAIDLNRFWFSGQMRSKVRQQLGFDDGQFIVGHVGRFTPQKNQGFLIEAFEKLAELRDDAMLVLVGTGEGEKAAKEAVLELGIAERVRFLGQRDDVADLYQAFDVFTLPSLYEGLGIVAIEAQAAGLPCLVSDAVPSEANITDSCEFLPINDIHTWAEMLNAIEPKTDIERADINHANFANYDIVRQGQWLTEEYMRIYKKAV